MNSLRRLCAGVIALAVAGTPIAASADCLNDVDAHAFMTSALQQKLMVAAFQCNDMAEYNNFVLSHRPELQQADAALLAFFQRGDPKGGTAAYNTYKTHLANVSALEDAHGYTFCGGANALYAAARATDQLDPVLDSMPVTDAVYAGCSRANVNPVVETKVETPPPVTVASNTTPTVDPNQTLVAENTTPTMEPEKKPAPLKPDQTILHRVPIFGPLLDGVRGLVTKAVDSL